MSKQQNIKKKANAKRAINIDIIDNISKLNISDEINKLSKSPNYANEISVQHLVDILKELSDAYYNKTSLVSDDVFDSLVAILETRDSNNKFLSQIGSPVKIEKEKALLPYPMASLTKIKPDKNNLKSWLDKYTGNYILSDKEDGISIQLYKKSSTEYNLYSRGDGTTGTDVSNLMKYIIHERVLLNDIPDGTSIRGELIMSKANFNSLTGKQKNARNTVAGLVNTKQINASFKKLIKLCDFVAYEIIYPRYTYSKQFELLQKWNFNVVPHKFVNALSYDILCDYLKLRRTQSIYDIDGIVVADNGRIYEYTQGNPDYAFAFKTVLSDQVSIATIKNIIWDVSMDGYLKPKIEIEPINLLGTTITYASAFNAKFIEDNKLGKGAVIKLVRSGDVIPYILEVVKMCDKPQMPDIPYKWNDTHVDIIVQDLYGAQSDNIAIKKLVHFFKTIKVKYLSEGILTKYVSHGYKTVFDILNAKHKDLALIDGFGDKLIDKIYASITDAFNSVELGDLMSASHIFGRGLGSKKINEILNKYPNIMHHKWDNTTFINNIMAVDGFSSITASKFCENFNDFILFFNKLTQIIDISRLNKTKTITNNNETNNNTLAGKTFVFTGFRNHEIENKIIGLGGKLTNSVSKNTTCVITNDLDNTSSKISDAQTKNVPVMLLTDFINKFLI